MSRSRVAGELYKDKIEVSLDSRQIFYLFFGGAVIVGLVFVLGVFVGRRVETRAHRDRAQTQLTADPLAALDRLAEGGGLTFQGALRGASSPPSNVESSIAQFAKQREAEAAPLAKSDADHKPVVAAHEPTKSERRDEKNAPAKLDSSSKFKFALQLSSFQVRAEAEAYLSQMKASGFGAYITEADVDGKTYYRVRVGNYRSIDAANDAKVELERATKKAATVMKLGPAER